MIEYGKDISPEEYTETYCVFLRGINISGKNKIAMSDLKAQIEIYQNIIFWTFDRKSYQKCNWWKKTASSSIAEKLTIRTAETIKKVCK